MHQRLTLLATTARAGQRHLALVACTTVGLTVVRLLFNGGLTVVFIFVLDDMTVAILVQGLETAALFLDNLRYLRLRTYAQPNIM